MKRFFVAATTLPALLAVAACMAETAPKIVGTGSCDAAALQQYIGKPETILAAMTFPAPMRVIHPTDRVTADVVPDRINFIIDANGIITDARCG